MNLKNITIIGFALTCLAQLYVPARMILNLEDVLKTGVPYKFRTRPIDPNDPFRGKYVALDFKDNTYPIDNPDDWGHQEKVFVSLATDSSGYAKIKSVEKVSPAAGDYIETTISYVNHPSEGKVELVLHFPFDRYYMEESKAQPAELAYREANLDTAQVAYALVFVKNGESVLKDVVIDGQSIKELVEK